MLYTSYLLITLINVIQIPALYMVYFCYKVIGIWVNIIWLVIGYKPLRSWLQGNFLPLQKIPSSCRLGCYLQNKRNVKGLSPKWTSCPSFLEVSYGWQNKFFIIREMWKGLSPKWEFLRILCPIMFERELTLNCKMTKNSMRVSVSREFPYNISLRNNISFSFLPFKLWQNNFLFF